MLLAMLSELYLDKISQEMKKFWFLKPLFTIASLFQLNTEEIFKKTEIPN